MPTRLLVQHIQVYVSRLVEDERDSRRLLHCNVSNADCRRGYWHSLNPSKLQLHQLPLCQRDKPGSLGSRRFVRAANRRLANSIYRRVTSGCSHKTGACKMRLLRVRWWLQETRLEPKVCNSCQVGDHEDCDVIGQFCDMGWTCACCGVIVEQ